MAAVRTLEISEPRDESVRKTQTQPAVVCPAAHTQERQHGQRAAFPKAADPFRTNRGQGRWFKTRVWIARINHAQRPDEPITFADHGLQKVWLRGVVAESGADFSHDVVDIGLGIDKKIRAPEFSHDVLAGNELIAPANEKNQQLHGLLLERNAPPEAAELVAPQVQFHLGCC